MEPLNFYDTYNGKGVVISAIGATAGMLLLALVGLVGNTCLIVAVFRHRFGTCGVLLSAGALGDILHQTSHYYMSYLMFTGKTFTDMNTCVYVNIVPVIGLNMSILMILFTAVDRLISVWLPLRHRAFKLYAYLPVYFLITLGFSVYILIEQIEATINLPNVPTTCLVIDGLPGALNQKWFTICLITNLLTIFCYLLIWLRLKFSSSIKTCKMFKSLLVLTLIVFFGWAVNACLQVVMITMHVDPVTHWIVGDYAGILVNFACSCNYFVLYAFSKDYRRAFRLQLNTISRLVRKKDFYISTSSVKMTLAWTNDVN